MTTESIPFYNDTEYWSPPNNLYPTWDDACRFVMSRTGQNAKPRMTAAEASKKLANYVHEIWTAGDGCPISVYGIQKLFTEKVKPIYDSYRRGDHCGTKRRHRKTDSGEKKEPQRKSTRIKSPEAASQTPEQLQQQQQPSEEADLCLSSPTVEGQTKTDSFTTPKLSSTETAKSASVATTSRRNPTRHAALSPNPRYEQWMSDYGNLMLDVFSLENMIKARKEDKAFDSDFYEDQKDASCRKMIIARVRVRSEWYQQEKKVERRRALQYARMLSQRGDMLASNKKDIDEFGDEEESTAMPELSPFKSPLAVSHKDISKSQIVPSIQTRSTSSKAKRIIDFKSSRSTSSQTESAYLIPPVSTRIHSKSTLCNPSYLQAGLLMMAVGNQSPAQAVLNMYIIDTEVYKQKRSLPLRLQKKYQKMLNTVKKVKAVENDSQENRSQTENEPSVEAGVENTTEKEAKGAKEGSSKEDETGSTDDQRSVETESQDLAEQVREEEQKLTEQICQDEPEVIVDDSNIEMNEEEQAKIDNMILNAEIQLDGDNEEGRNVVERAEKYVQDLKEYHKKNLDEILPDPRTLREAERVASVFLEGKVAQEIVKAGTAYVMPDGTSRAKVGKIGASIVHVGDKVRALKTQKLGGDTQANWVDTIIHQLDRLANASDLSVKEIYECIKGIISDSSSVNIGLASAISAQLGVKWIPGQLYCCIHTVLGFQNDMVKLWLHYQSLVGYEKMYPEITGLELDMEGKCLIKQILECFFRLTADRWQARAWNKYEEFDQFCRDNHTINLSQQLHGNRFGELEKCCGIGLYLLEIWHKFIHKYSNVRNQLAIFLRDTSHLMDVCNFLWLGPALIGIHLTEPYLLLLIEKKVTHLDLLDILPKLHKELTEYPRSLAQISEPAFRSLAEGWINPLSSQAPYHVEVGKAISKAIEKCETVLLNKFCKELCSAMGDVLQRQRGDAYGFSGKSEPSEELVTNQFTTEQLQTALTHTKDIENLFGVEDAIISRFGGQVFDKSTDDLIIRYSKDLLSHPSDWCSKKMRKKKRELDQLQQKFDEKQRALLKAGVSKTDATILKEENKIQRVVQQCRKSHNGPIESQKELENLCAMFDKDEKSLRSALVFEIRYRKFTVLNIKDDNPLFSQVNLTIGQLKENLKLLLTKTDRTMASTVTMADLEKVIGIGKAIVDPLSEDICEQQNSEEHASVIPTETNRSQKVSDTVEKLKQVGWPPQLGEHIAASFDSGFYIGEVVGYIDDDTVDVSYMEVKQVLTSSVQEHPRKFWFWPSPQKKHPTNKHCVLDLRPAELTLAIPPSTRRNLVFSLGNAELLDRLWSETE